MNNPYGYIAGVLLLIAFGFGVGWEVNGWREAGNLADEKAAHARDLKVVSDAASQAIIEYQQKQAADLKRIVDISDQYQGELNRAKSENDDLLARINAGTERLFVAAHCSGNQVSAPSAATASLNADRAELDPAARSAYTALREAIEQSQAQIQGLQDYIRTITRN